MREFRAGNVAAVRLGVKVVVQDTAPASAEFDHAALVAAFFPVVGLAGIVGVVAVDGLGRLARGTW